MIIDNTSILGIEIDSLKNINENHIELVTSNLNYEFKEEIKSIYEIEITSSITNKQRIEIFNDFILSISIKIVFKILYQNKLDNAQIITFEYPFICTTNKFEKISGIKILNLTYTINEQKIYISLLIALVDIIEEKEITYTKKNEILIETDFFFDSTVDFI